MIAARGARSLSEQILCFLPFESIKNTRIAVSEIFSNFKKRLLKEKTKLRFLKKLDLFFFCIFYIL